MKRHGLIFAFTLAACVGCDHVAKELATGALDAAPISLAGDLVRFDLAHNPGAFLSLGADLPPAWRSLLLVVAAPLALACLCVLGLRAGFRGWSLLGLSLLAGGGVGNWLDRLLHDGAVTDFVSLGLGPLRTGIFNLADVFIMAGVALVLLDHSPGKGSQRSA